MSLATRRVAVIGGGLAGLSTTYHLLELCSNTEVTVWDPHPVGTGGASSVAGGYVNFLVPNSFPVSRIMIHICYSSSSLAHDDDIITKISETRKFRCTRWIPGSSHSSLTLVHRLLHPLSPRGKLVHRGLEGLAATNRLVDRCRDVDPNVVLRDELWRLAVSDKNAEILSASPIGEWQDRVPFDGLGTEVRGGLRLSDGCKVLHVPTYLQALWNICQQSGRARWKTEDLSELSQEERRNTLSEYSDVVLAAGDGLFRSGLLDANRFPIQLVRGQSIHFRINSSDNLPAVVSGKYISPLPDPSLVLVGATHEFREAPLSNDEVVAELESRAGNMIPDLFQNPIDCLTSGTRVQSERGKSGRLPIAGKLPSESHSNLHPSTWIFTGLSSRGLLYHALYGEALARTMIDGEASRTEVEGWCLARLQ